MGKKTEAAAGETRQHNESESARDKLPKESSLEERSEKMLRMIDGVPAGLGALRVVRGVPDDMLQLNRYFRGRADLDLSKSNTVDYRHFLSCIHPGDRERCRADFKGFLDKGSMQARQYRFRSTDGAYYWCSVRCEIVPVSDDVEIVYFVYTDIDDLKTAEANLEKGRRAYERTVDVLQVAMWTYDIANQRIVCGDNKATEKLRVRYGWPKVFENVPESLLETVEDDVRDSYSAMFREIEAGHDAVCDVWYRQLEGMEPCCERESYHVVCDDEGNPVTAYGVGIDVTAQKKVEERYAREMAYLHNNSDESLVAKGHYDLTKNLVLEYDVRADKNVFITKRGLTCDGACQNFINMAYSDEDREKVADTMDRKNLIRRYQQGQMQATVQYRLASDGGIPVWHSTTVHTYMNPQTGNLELFSYAYDITERKLLENVMDMVSGQAFDYIGFIYAQTGLFAFVEKGEDIAFPEVRVKTPYRECCEYVEKNFVDEGEQAQFRSIVDLDGILTALEKASHYIATYRRTENGRTLCKQLDFTWFDKEGKIILVTRSDVTVSYERDQKQLREIENAKLEADRANEAKSTFLSGMSHDIRTPLNGIVGFTDFALAEDDPQVARGYMEKVKTSADLLLSLINDVLDLSRIESGKVMFNPEPTPADDLGFSVAEALRPSAEEKGIKLISEPSPDKMVYVDKLKHQKIWVNLLSNAIKYTPEGGTVEARVEVIDPPVDGHNRRLIVADNGIGMTEEFQRTMFDPFSQERRSETQGIQGTGLGLAIVKRYVDLLGGTIKVHSVRGEGTRYEIEVSIKTLEEGVAAKEKAQRNIGALSGMHVLLCEDNDMNAEIAHILLVQKGIEVDRAENGFQGVQMFEASEPGFYDAVLMDVRMPVMDGHQATRAIRVLDREDAAHVPIIALTADAFEEDIRENRAVGMDGQITKPINPERLYEALYKTLGDR